ncbi:MAG: prfA [Sphingomonas bacterium]|uniref:peptide chain release factor family protein n=1 Tax=Sphingomonas bacterium TaxID=1895847 RepID=UPI00261A9922|nr:peptide chain release factor-like protein [Sphingomonas bacterium]MDB5703234.1 prfA [Sphingomonas bacterium]
MLDGLATAGAALHDADVRERWFSGTGAGGQHRNKHQNSVELHHLPTGLRRTAQTRSRETSRRAAWEALAAALSAQSESRAAEDMNQLRARQIGLGMRADKRRTYRFRDDRVVDDLTGLSASCTRVMRGHIDLLWPAADRPGG